MNIDSDREKRTELKTASVAESIPSAEFKLESNTDAKVPSTVYESIKI
jgi:hypothetical protein